MDHETQENAVEIDEPQQLKKLLASQQGVASALTQAESLHASLQIVLEQVYHVLAYDACLITLASTDGRALRIAAADGEEVGGMAGLELPLEQGINAWVYRHGVPVLVPDADVDPRRLHISGHTESIRAAAGAPLIVDGRTIGTIYAARRTPHTLTEAHLGFLAFTATQVAAAVQRARLLDEAQQRAEQMELVNTDLREMVKAQAHLLQAIDEMEMARRAESSVMGDGQ